MRAAPTGRMTTPSMHGVLNSPASVEQRFDRLANNRANKTYQPVQGEADSMDESLCRACADWAFARWCGWCSVGTEDWKEKPSLPAVPLLASGRCPRCGGTAGLRPEDVCYEGVYGPSNSEHPDFFRLVVASNNAAGNHRWGRPYRDPWVFERLPLECLEGRVIDSRCRDVQGRPSEPAGNNP